nr:Serine/threonine-protein kinase Nek3 [Polyrhizophydium stewartii]
MKPCPSVVQIVESFEEHGALFIVTELAEHGNLAQAIHSRCGRYFAERVVLAWTGQLARAVAFVHGERILHRDIKTKNVLIDAADRIRLADFGAARRIPSLATRVADRLTSGRSVALAVTTIGTPLNMAPELLHGEAYGAPADMWATGCVMHQMLALAHPFASSTIAELVSKVIGGGRQALPAHLSRFSGTLVERMLQPNPSRRITAAQLAGVIEAVSSGVTAHRVGR